MPEKNDDVQDEEAFSEGIEKISEALDEAADKLYELADSLAVTGIFR
jgi:hypothetical protein